jgi:hypothetical protein
MIYVFVAIGVFLLMEPITWATHKYVMHGFLWYLHEDHHQKSDGFFEKNLKPWDIAAGTLLITEAGGIVGDFHGEADYLYKGNVIAGSPKIFSQMLNVLSPFA